MTKCDFCTLYDPKKGCFYVSQVARKDDCLIAIKRMTEALRNIGVQKND